MKIWKIDLEFKNNQGSHEINRFLLKKSVYNIWNYTQKISYSIEIDLAKPYVFRKASTPLMSSAKYNYLNRLQIQPLAFPAGCCTRWWFYRATRHRPRTTHTILGYWSKSEARVRQMSSCPHLSAKCPPDVNQLSDTQKQVLSTPVRTCPQNVRQLRKPRN